MSLDSEPRAVTYPPVPHMLITDELENLYEYASKREEDETATVPLYEKFFTVWMDCLNLSVWSQQRLDDTQQKVDLAIGFTDTNHQHPLVFVLLVECKRNNGTDLGELRAQVQDYATRYLDIKVNGRAREHSVFLATAFGTKIRFFEESLFDTNSETGGAEVGREHYWDLKADGEKIRKVLREIWEFRASLRPYRG